MPTFCSAADTRLRRWVPTRLTRALIVIVFATSSLLQMIGVPFTSSFGTRTRIDLDVYRLGAQIWQQGQSLYADGSMPFTSDGIWLPFTYPPFAAMTFVPLGAMTLTIAGVVMSLLTIGLLVVVVHIVLTVLSVGRIGNRWWLALLVSTAALWLNPMWMTLGFGQINVILMAMIVVDVFLVGRGRRRALGPLQGVLVGLAAAIKLTPLVFIVLFASARRWRAVVTAAATFVAAAALAWIWMPSDSWGYWTHTLFHTTRIGDPSGRINQNLNAMWIRLLPEASAAQLAWVLSSLVATALAGAALFACKPVAAFGRGAGRTGRVNALLATCVVAVWGLLVSPTSWAHHWVWSITLILTSLVVAARTDSRRAYVAYNAIAVSGILIFAVGPYQFLPMVARHWTVFDHIVGNAFSLWGIAALIVIWLLPFSPARAATRAADQPLAEIRSA